MEPSFSLLFKRGKYRSFVPVADEDENEQSEKERDEKRREIERYLTTAIGFCAKHDRAFRAHLLTSVCGIPERLALSRVDVSVEPHYWGDLVITSRKNEFACVVECKVHAKLQGWQNPEMPDFEKKGYGASILEDFKNQRDIRYIVLGWYQPLSLPKQGRIIYLQKDWSNLSANFPQRRPLAADLYLCLAALGVPAFLLKETQNMKLGTNTKFLAQAISLLPAVQIDAGLDETTTKFDCHALVGGGWYFGVVIKQTNKTNTARYKLQKFINPRHGRDMGWYGYLQEDKKSGTFLSTQLYCRNAAARKAVKNRLIKNGINPAYIKADYKDDYAVDVRAPTDVINKEHLSGDRFWFSKVLKAAMKGS